MASGWVPAAADDDQHGSADECDARDQTAPTDLLAKQLAAVWPKTMRQVHKAILRALQAAKEPPILGSRCLDGVMHAPWQFLPGASCTEVSVWIASPHDWHGATDAVRWQP